MTVYVDQAEIPYRGMLMSHMVADSREELLGMADRIDLDRRHLQDVGTPKEHFDVCKSKREAAVAAGAELVPAERIVQIIREKRFPYVWYWREKLGSRKGERCRILARDAGRMNTIAVEFTDGHLVFTSGWAVRRPEST